MLRCGAYQVTAAVLSRFRLDGGAMFGVLPRVVWERLETPDALHRVSLVARVLHFCSGRHSVLVDTGLGQNFQEQETERFAISSIPQSRLPFRWEELTHVILTHLHFDHAGGLYRSQDLGPRDQSERPHAWELRAPQAQIVVQRANWERALSPGCRERASYRREDIRPLERTSLVLPDGEEEILPGVSVSRSDGHTRGMQWVKVSCGGETLAFPSDLVSTSKHLHLPFVTGYDMCLEALLREKEGFLRQAVDGRWTVVFAHDKDVAAGRITTDAKGRFCLAEVLQR